MFFASDGLRQDLVAKYAAEGLMPTMAGFLKTGANGRRQRAPDAGAAEHRAPAGTRWRPVPGPASTAPPTTRSTSTGRRWAPGPRRLTPNVLQVETIAQAAERGGLKVAQMEWAGGRNATIQGPTIDFQSFFSGRGVATNFIGEAGDALFDDAPFITSFGLQFDHPAGYARPGPIRRRRADCRHRMDGHASVDVQPGHGDAAPRARRHRRDKYGLNAWIFDSTNDNATNYDKVLFSKTQERRRLRRDPREGPDGPTSRSRSKDGALAGQTAGMLVKVEELTADLSRSGCSTPP